LFLISCGSDPDTGELTRKTKMTSDHEEGAAENEQFLYEAAQGNMKEIKLGQLAMEKGSIREVRDLGKMMYEDHSASLKELRTLAGNKHISLPGATSDDFQDTYDDLKSKSGSDFDRDYCNMMIDDHKKDIEKFETVSNRSNDEDIRNLARKTLPTLKHHLLHSKECKKTCEQKENM
jgi:putative membrane protein